MRNPCKKELHYLANKIRTIRIQNEMNQERLAEMADCHKNHIGRIERAQADPSYTMICKIARALKTSPRNFMPEK
jgi:transcriptional regulator with XRE-family HTH domain